MTTESECRPITTGMNADDGCAGTPASEAFVENFVGEFMENFVEDFADFDKMNASEPKARIGCEFQRHKSETSFAMDRGAGYRDLKALGRACSLDVQIPNRAIDLEIDSLSADARAKDLKDSKDTNDLIHMKVVKDAKGVEIEEDFPGRTFQAAETTSRLAKPNSWDRLDNDCLDSVCLDTDHPDTDRLDSCLDGDFDRAFRSEKVRQSKTLRDTHEDHCDNFCDNFRDFGGPQDARAAVDYDLGGGCTTGDEDWDSDGRPTGERWPPLGAPNDEEDNQSLYSYSEFSWNRTSNGRSCEEERLKQLEEEQEQLNNSLMALTSHFAQVQFRLKQIVDASPEEKENLLQELEEFANRGIPDLREASACKADGDQECKEDSGGVARQKELIEKLKQQLEDLETYAYQTGEGGPPQAKVMEKQRVVLEQLKGKLNLNVDEFDKLTVDDLRSQVDGAIRELVNPLKMKEQLVAQLQTQITDLERFIKFLQGEAGETEVAKPQCKCKEPHHRHPGDGRSQDPKRRKFKPGLPTPKSPKTSTDKEQLRKETENIMKRATILLNMLSFGCGPTHAKFQKNTLKKTPQGNHYGDLRASLEVAVNNILEILGPETPADSDYTSDSEETPVMAYHEELTIAVRKQLAPALRDLIQHGLMPVGQSQSLVPFLACFPQRSQRATKLLHAWDLILKYYHLKKGEQYNRTPARRLSQSFNLEINGGSAITNKQSLLTVIGGIIASHTPFKRSYDSHFKAFVCAGLNQKKLITWLRLIFRTQILTENYYQSWSYASKTGFEDAFRTLEKLQRYNFDLPVDLAVRPFQNIKDAF